MLVRIAATSITYTYQHQHLTSTHLRPQQPPPAPPRRRRVCMRVCRVALSRGPLPLRLLRSASYLLPHPPRPARASAAPGARPLPSPPPVKPTSAAVRDPDRPSDPASHVAKGPCARIAPRESWFLHHTGGISASFASLVLGASKHASPRRIAASHGPRRAGPKPQAASRPAVGHKSTSPVATRQRAPTPTTPITSTLHITSTPLTPLTSALWR